MKEPHDQSEPGEPGKWDFKDDYERRKAIVAETEARYSRIFAIVFIVALAAVMIASAAFHSPIIKLSFGRHTAAPPRTSDGP